MLIFFMLPIILSSVLGGFGPGLIATAIASLGVDYYSIPPLHSLGIKESHDLFQWFMLIASGILSSCLSELLHRARRQVEERRILQKIAQETLRESEKKYRLITENTADLISILDMNLHFTYVSPACMRLHGFTVEEVMELTLEQVLTPKSMKLGLAVYEKEMLLEAKETVNSERTRILELEAYKKDGSIIWVEASLSFLYDKDRNPVEILIVSRDITDRKLAERALRESEAKHRLLFENANDAIFIIDTKTRLLAANQMATMQLGYTNEELISMTISQVNSPEGGQRAAERLAMLMEQGHLTFETVHVHKDGSHIPVEISAKRITWDGQPAIMSICRNISDRKQFEEALRESEEKFRLTFGSSPDAVTISRLDDGRYVDINEGFTRATGFTREEVIGKTPLEKNIWHDPSDREKLIQGLREKGFIENLEVQFRMKDGSLMTTLMSARVFSLKGAPHIISIARDITERKMIKAKLQQVQKIEAIGTLAGGIAHDFNNLLMGIQGRASLISLDLETSHPHWEHIRAIEEYIRSATNLTKQLLGFAQGGKYEVKPVDMNELLLSSSAMFGRTKKEIHIHTKCQKSSLVVEADRGQIEQVLLNMYINAWQAMPPDGGELYLETRIVTLDEAFCKPYQTEPGRYVKVSITDTGAGMDEATRMQIFDPFFTTKEKSRGTGLGLASAYGIIKNHGGMITVYSEIGHGTTFNIYLPVSNKKALQEVSLEEGLIKGSATILLVDDEELIIDVGQAMLESMGYRVVVSRGGQEAVKAITDLGNEIDLVILDLIMPGMDGEKTFGRIREIQPEMPVILSSGYAINGKATGSFKSHIIFQSFHKKLEKCWMKQNAQLLINYPKQEY